MINFYACNVSFLCAKEKNAENSWLKLFECFTVKVNFDES